LGEFYVAFEPASSSSVSWLLGDGCSVVAARRWLVGGGCSVIDVRSRVRLSALQKKHKIFKGEFVRGFGLWSL
jgi:hypothetical protein